MQEIIKRIKNRRQELKLSFQDVADLTGMSKSTLQRYETGGIKNIPLDRLKVLASALKVSPSFLMGWETETLSPIKIRTKKITVYGSIPAGIPVDSIEDIIGEFEFPANFLTPGAIYIGLKVKGESMKPDYLDGDVLAIKLQPDCETGQIAAVYVNGYDATLKKIIKKENAIILEPLNKEYETQIFIGKEMEQIKIMGIVDAMFRTNKR